MEGIEKLDAEIAEINDDVMTAIWEYLKTRQDLQDKFNNEEKSGEGLYDYIYSKAEKKKTKRNMAMVDNNVVYLWGIAYFSKTNEELGIKEKKVMPPSPEEVIKKIEKKEEQYKKKEKDDNQISLFQEVGA